MLRRWVVLCLAVSYCSSGIAADLTSVDLIPKSGWSYFYNATGADETLFQNALTESGFYDHWVTSDSGGQDVLGNSWQSGALPIGHRTYQPDKPTPLATSIDLPSDFHRRRTVFLRRTFDIPDGVSDQIAMEISYENGHTVYIDGEEIERINCCVVDYRGSPTVGQPGFLDYAKSPWIEGRALSRLPDLGPGEHTIAVSLHAADYPPPADGVRTSLDVRLFSIGNERPWLDQEYSGDWHAPSSWLVGVPDSTSFVSLGFRSSTRISNDGTATFAGIRFESEFTTLHGSGDIVAGNSSDSASFIVRPDSQVSIENSVSLKNVAEFDVQTNGRLSLEGVFDPNGHDITKSGKGSLALGPAPTPFGEAATILLKDGQLQASDLLTSFHGDIVSTGGTIDLLSSTSLMVTRDVTAPVRMNLSPDGDSAALHGDGTGDLTIPELTVDIPISMVLTGAETFRLFSDWESIEIGTVHLPNLGLVAEWDTSQLSEGVLSVRATDVSLSCDIDGSKFCDVLDLDQVLDGIRSNSDDQALDMNEDGVVDVKDRDEWLVLAGRSVGFESLLPGDVTFDNTVTAADLMTLGHHWQSEQTGWSNGDLYPDGVVDVKDLNIVGQAWQLKATRLPATTVTLAPMPASAVPEPASHLLLFAGGVALFAIVRRVNRRIVVAVAVTAILLTAQAYSFATWSVG